MSPWVADASPLIFLAKLGRLELLKQAAPEILIPGAVLREVAAYPDPAAQAVAAATRTWLRVAQVGDRRLLALLTLELGQGEAEALCLASERGARHVVLDDLDARRLARRLSLEPIGTLGVLLAARLRGELPSLRDEIRRLRTEGFFANDTLVEAVLKSAGEA